MPRGPNGEKRPADVIGCATMVAKIATKEIHEPKIDEKAVVRKAGRKGGKARAASLSPSERKEQAAMAAKARWGGS